MIFTAYRLELFKTLRRAATWVTFLCFLALTILLLNTERNGPILADRHRFPEALPAVLTGDAGLLGTFGVVIIVLMICNEFDWRTSRQNIIDGLSKRQWFTGKLLLIPTVAIALYLTRLAVGVILALLTTSHAPAHPFDPTSGYVLAACGVLLGSLCYAAVALFICVTVRSTGPTLAVALLYQIIDSIAAMLLRGHHLGNVAQWLPLQIQGALATYARYQPQGLGAHDPSGPMQTQWLFAAAVAWVAGLVFVSYRIYMKRDL